MAEKSPYDGVPEADWLAITEGLVKSPGLCARVGLRLLALAAGLWHNAEIGQPGRSFAAYGR